MGLASLTAFANRSRARRRSPGAGSTLGAECRGAKSTCADLEGTRASRVPRLRAGTVGRLSAIEVKLAMPLALLGERRLAASSGYPIDEKNGCADDRIQSTAVVALRPLVGPVSPEQSLANCGVV